MRPCASGRTFPKRSCAGRWCGSRIPIPAGAVDDLAQALAVDPDNWTALEGLAAVFRSLGDDAAAALAYDQALIINPWLTDARAAREKLAPEVDGREI